MQYGDMRLEFCKFVFQLQTECSTDNVFAVLQTPVKMSYVMSLKYHFSLFVIRKLFFMISSCS